VRGEARGCDEAAVFGEDEPLERTETPRPLGRWDAPHVRAAPSLLVEGQARVFNFQRDNVKHWNVHLALLSLAV
jgi:hypothetical protein